MCEDLVVRWMLVAVMVLSSFEAFTAPDPSPLRGGMWSTEVVVNQVNAICGAE